MSRKKAYFDRNLDDCEMQMVLKLFTFWDLRTTEVAVRMEVLELKGKLVARNLKQICRS